MRAINKSLTHRKAWKAIASDYQRTKKLHLRMLFTDDPKRGERVSAEAIGLFLDYSKNHITVPHKGHASQN